MFIKDLFLNIQNSEAIRLAAEAVGREFALAGWPQTSGNPPDLMDLQDQAILDGVLPETGFGRDFTYGFIKAKDEQSGPTPVCTIILPPLPPGERYIFG